ncbi:HupE/UreJ family protein [Roseibium album]|uniref:HupE / UreJ protein n=1 Tax=Roseibium album TaxID=311410 RepID=A0A0M7AUB3_9HYPH|nr:HupE/UreJ family protein [Roseibium album]CTQ61935.1 HupE / UreJ protein [Roseibium album]CTQ78207.1 HupE / UreJ protein [Roseibium album]CTQ79700.1 HupE / UreJ protein [Roseibium album]
MTRLLISGAFLILASACISNLAHGHALQPGYVSLEQKGENIWQVFWRKPDVSGKPMPIDLLLPSGCSPRKGPLPSASAGAWEAVWTAVCEEALPGSVVSIPGLENTQTDVLLRFVPSEKTAVSLRLTADATSAVLPKEPGPFKVLGTYAGLGFVHILEGWDHLLFLFALLVLVRGFWRLVGAVTAFTVAHSLTLAASTLGWIALPPAPVEAVIALSIVFLASEIALSTPDEKRLSQSAPWVVTFAFGLLHGLGFAGALKEIGLPQSDIPLALFAFNVGVEAGQLAFIVLATVIVFAVSRLLRKGPVLARRPVGLTLAYMIGSLSSFWLIERVLYFSNT